MKPYFSVKSHPDINVMIVSSSSLRQNIQSTQPEIDKHTNLKTYFKKTI